MKLGLLGAIGGVGQAMTDAGTDIIKRREAALEAARKRAEDERKSQAAAAERKEEYGFRAAQTQYTEGQTNKRAQDNRTHEATQKGLDRDFKVADREDEQDFRITEIEEKAEVDRNLTQYKTTLDRQNDAASIRERAKLEGGGYKGIKYGNPDKNGRAQTWRVKSDYTLEPGPVINIGQLTGDRRDEEGDGTNPYATAG